MGEGLTVKQQNRITISEHLRSTAQALLAGIVGALAFVMTSREPSRWFWILPALSAFTLALSMYFAGRGISEVQVARADKPRFFNRQAWAVLIGFLLLGATVAFVPVTPRRDSSLEHSVVALNDSVIRLRQDIVSMRAQLVLLTTLVADENSDSAGP